LLHIIIKIYQWVILWAPANQWFADV